MFSDHVEAALRVAHAAHAGQVRKGDGGVPYVTHPVHVALMLARLSCDEAVLCAALLHDVVEDCEGWTLERIEADFGAEVRAIVSELTEDKSLTWEERKRGGIARVRRMSPAATTIKAADKLHNLRSILLDLRAGVEPASVWRPFSRGPEPTLELARLLVDELAPRVDPRLGEELRATLEELEQLSRT